MFNWLRAFFETTEVKALRLLVEATKKLADEIGGTDKVVKRYLSIFYSNPDKMRRLRLGLLPEDEYPLPRGIIGTAAINSIMAAKNDLIDDPANHDAKERLECAEEAFLMSWLHLTKADLAAIPRETMLKSIGEALDDWGHGKSIFAASENLPQKHLADERLDSGRLALEKWRNANPSEWPYVMKA